MQDRAHCSAQFHSSNSPVAIRNGTLMYAVYRHMQIYVVLVSRCARPPWAATSRGVPGDHRRTHRQLTHRHTPLPDLAGAPALLCGAGVRLCRTSIPALLCGVVVLYIKQVFLHFCVEQVCCLVEQTFLRFCVGRVCSPSVSCFCGRLCDCPIARLVCSCGADVQNGFRAKRAKW